MCVRVCRAGWVDTLNVGEEGRSELEGLKRGRRRGGFGVYVYGGGGGDIHVKMGKVVSVCRFIDVCVWM